MRSYHRKLQHFSLRNFFEKHFNFFQKYLRNTFREKLYQPFDYKNHVKNIRTWFVAFRWFLWIAAIENWKKFCTWKFFQKKLKCVQMKIPNQPFDYTLHVKLIDTWFVYQSRLLWIATIEIYNILYLEIFRKKLQFLLKLPSKYVSGKTVSAIWLYNSCEEHVCLIHVSKMIIMNSCHRKSEKFCT